MAGWEGPPEVYLNYFVYLILFPESWDSPLPPAGQSSASGHWFLFQHLPRTRSPSGSSPGSRHQGKESCLPIPAPPPDPYPCYFHTGPPPPLIQDTPAASTKSANCSAPYQPGCLG